MFRISQVSYGVEVCYAIIPAFQNINTYIFVYVRSTESRERLLRDSLGSLVHFNSFTSTVSQAGEKKNFSYCHRHSEWRTRA